jgi:hypothetical protein
MSNITDIMFDGGAHHGRRFVESLLFFKNARLPSGSLEGIRATLVSGQ